MTGLGGTVVVVVVLVLVVVELDVVEATDVVLPCPPAAWPLPAPAHPASNDASRTDVMRRRITLRRYRRFRPRRADCWDLGTTDWEVSSPVSTLAGRYELGELLGRGGMSAVRAGRDLRLGRDVAVKLLAPAGAKTLRMRERFEADARAVVSLSHPNMVLVFDSGEHEGSPSW